MHLPFVCASQDNTPCSPKYYLFTSPGLATRVITQQGRSETCASIVTGFWNKRNRCAQARWEELAFVLFLPEVHCKGFIFGQQEIFPTGNPWDTHLEIFVYI